MDVGIRIQRLSWQASVIRKVWILSGRAFGKGLLGPAVRLCEMARSALENGHEVHVAVLDPESDPLPQGVHLHNLRDLDLGSIRAGDGLVFGPYLPAGIAWRLLRSGLPFHLDLYCLTATEQMALWAKSPGRARDVERAKLRKRYLLHAMAAESIQVSCLEQWMVVAGMLLSERDWSRGGLAESLTRKVVEVPMGVREAAFPQNSANPYPQELQGRPVFLWGGSLWNWFDLETLHQAFRLLDARGSKAALFFLSGGNRTERSSENAPLLWMEDKARESGLLGRGIFFNSVSVAPQELAPWLEHCRAGILTNPASLEALSSWRTRYLDLLWARKPLVVSGVDPLGSRMLQSGCALRVAAGDAPGLADIIDRLASSPELSASMGASASGLASSLSWKRNLAPFVDALADPASFKDAGRRPSLLDGLGYLLT